MQNVDLPPSETLRDDIPASSCLSELNHIVQTDRIPNALLFCGPSGSGRMQTAFFFAKACNCRARGKDPVTPVLPAKK